MALIQSDQDPLDIEVSFLYQKFKQVSPLVGSYYGHNYKQDMRLWENKKNGLVEVDIELLIIKG